MNASQQIRKGISLYKAEKFEEAKKVFLKLVKKEPRDHHSYCYLNVIYQRLFDYDKAETAIKKAIAINPKSSAALLLYSSMKQEEGDWDMAKDLCYKALAANDGNELGAWINLAKIDPTDEVAIDKLHELFDEKLPIDKYAACCFIFGDYHDKRGEYDQAYHWYLKGNNKKQWNGDLYSHQSHKHYIAAIKDIFTPENVSLAVGHQSADPIFIVGMPRSGTTLTEQIISAHPQVTAGGELPYLTRLANETNFDEHLMMNFQQLGKKYLSQVGIKGKFTDKLPNNFHFLGLIRCMFPNAKIVHVTRNREDTLLSCWKANFTHGNLYTHSWRDLSDFYDDYLDIVGYWDFIPHYTLSYESLVTNQEEETRNLIDYLGLEWNEACLSPEANKRKVRTASVQQVRNPVSSKSVGSFENYRKYLEPES